MSMGISGPNMGTYDAGYLQAVQREVARSVKSDVLRELGDVDEQLALALQGNIEDMVTLSPAARAYLKKLRRKLQKRQEEGIYEDDYADFDDEDDEDKEEVEKDFHEMMKDLNAFRRNEAESELKNEKKSPVFPRSIQLSGQHPKPLPKPVKKRAEYSPLREKINRMIYYAPTEKARELVQAELEPMGDKIVTMIKNFGAHIIVLEKSRALTDLKIKNMYVVAPSEKTFDGRPWSQVRGLYDSSRRLLVLGEEQLGRQGHSVARHEFAHAYDHAFSEIHERRLPLSVQLWNKFRNSRTGLISEYAATNPAEYFAESTEAFFQPELRPLMEARDPEICAYLKELFSGD